MMVFSNSLTDVERYEVIGQDIYVLNKQTLYLYEGNTRQKVSDFPSRVLYGYNGLLLSGKDFYYDPKLGALVYPEEIQGLYYQNISHNHLLLFSSDTEDVIYDVNTSSIVDRIPCVQDGRFYMLLDNTFIGLGEHFLSLYSLESHQRIWQLDYSTMIEAQRVVIDTDLVVHQGKLYFYLYSHSPYTHSGFCVDLATGQVLHRYPSFGYNMVLFGHQIGVASATLAQVLDTRTQQLAAYDLSPLLDPHRLLIGGRNIFTGDGLLYFRADDDRQGSHIGIIHLGRGELLWLHAFNPTPDSCKTLARSIRLVGDRIYVEAAPNRLLVFEPQQPGT